jgi:ubiquinone/menaquinone biosynthesis C-methylase UbiE
MDKWTSSTWFFSTQAEFYEGAEYITSPAADALIQQAFSSPHILPAGFTAPKILDAGCGLAQLTAQLQKSQWKDSQVVCLDKDESLVRAVEEKVKKYGWENVEVVNGSVEVSLLRR